MLTLAPPPRTQVGLFAPPEEISAAVMMETLYFYALAHQNDFDGESGKGLLVRGMWVVV